jgi:hypothetical protein
MRSRIVNGSALFQEEVSPEALSTSCPTEHVIIEEAFVVPALTAELAVAEGVFATVRYMVGHKFQLGEPAIAMFNFYIIHCRHMLLVSPEYVACTERFNI